MKWLEALFGQARVPKAQLDRLFALSTAQVTLETTLGLRPTGRAGLAFRAVESSYFETAERELRQLLEAATRESGTAATRVRDEYGYEWLVLQDPELEDLVATAHQVGLTLQEHGFGDRLLAAVFAFAPSEGEKRPVYWVYNYKRASFYPFAPLPGEKRRDNPLELRLAAVMARELPIEPQRERWYALWGAPVE